MRRLSRDWGTREARPATANPPCRTTSAQKARAYKEVKATGIGQLPRLVSHFGVSANDIGQRHPCWHSFQQASANVHDYANKTAGYHASHRTTLKQKSRRNTCFRRLFECHRTRSDGQMVPRRGLHNFLPLLLIRKSFSSWRLALVAQSRDTRSTHQHHNSTQLQSL